MLRGHRVADLDPPAAPPCEPCGTRTPRTLETIAAEVARVHEFTLDDLRSKLRRHDLARAREEFARRALQEGVANLSQVARYLNRAPSTLSDLLYGRR